MPLTDQASETRRTDRDVVAMTLIVWLAQTALVITRLVTGQVWDDPAYGWSRPLGSALGCVCCLLIHAWLRPRPGERILARLAQALGLALLACLAVTALVEFIYLQYPDYLREQYGLTPQQMMRNQNNYLFIGASSIFLNFLWVFVAWTGLYASTLHAAEVRDRDRRLAEAEGVAHRAQLMALRFQINPHFLFNALNALSALITLGRNAEAERVVLNLSAFLRHSLTTSPEQKVTLKEEIDTQQRYLEIERARFSDRMSVEIDVPPTLQAALVPSLILQPLLENAVKYAVTPAVRPVRVSVTARQDGAALAVTVADDGSGTASPVEPEHGAGIGLTNVRERLKAFYGAAGRLETRTRDGGFVAELRLPLETAP